MPMFSYSIAEPGSPELPGIVRQVGKAALKQPARPIALDLYNQFNPDELGIWVKVLFSVCFSRGFSPRLGFPREDGYITSVDPLTFYLLILFR